jgi:hypothetical protein
MPLSRPCTLPVALAVAIGVWSPPSAHADSPVQALIGKWLGPALGDTGRCGAAYSQLLFGAGNTFSYVQNTNACGGISGGGHFLVSGQQMQLHFEYCNTCAVYGYPPNITEGFRLPDANTLMLCDAPPGRCYTYHRD